MTTGFRRKKNLPINLTLHTRTLLIGGGQGKKQARWLFSDTGISGFPSPPHTPQRSVVEISFRLSVRFPIKTPSTDFLAHTVAHMEKEMVWQ